MKRKVFSLIIIGFLVFVIGLRDNKIKAATNYNVGIVNTSGGNLNVRSSSSTTSTVITKIKDGSYVSIKDYANSFYYVEYENKKYGYVSSSYITAQTKSTRLVNTSGANLNVRSEASLSGEVIDKLSDQTSVILLSSSYYFSNVLYNGNKTGYVYNTYLKANNTYQSVSLNVVSYKQFDSRWASNYVGSTSYTMKSIGCAITSLSMTESYRTSTTITPKNMHDKLSFTETGALYWPSNYNLVSSKTNYLTNIYNILLTGKPVILGCSNSNGSHYIVITGFTGGNSLTSDLFTINDPGSSSRTLLSEYLSIYPTFIKYVYYN